MDNFMNKYFGPLGPEYCLYFYIMSISFGILFLLTLFTTLSYGITNYKKENSLFCINSFFMLTNSFMAYLVNRLLNTMCIKSVM